MGKHIQYQEELLADKEMLAQMLGAMPVAFVFQNPDGRMIYVSKEFERLLGYTIDDIQTEDEWMSLAYPDEQYRKHVKRTWKEIAEQILNKNAKPKPQEMLVACKDGSQKYIEFNAVLLGGNFLVSLVDVTERRLQEEKLRNSEIHYKTLAESAFEGIVISLEGVITDTNDQYAALLGCTRADLIGTRIIEHVVPECHETVTQAIKTNRHEPYECVLTKENGECVEVLVRGKLVLIGDTPCRISVIHDLTEQKRTENELRSANTSLKTLIDSSPLAIVVFSLDRNITLWNPAAEKLYGWSADEVIGHPAPYVPEDKSEQYNARWQGILLDSAFESVDSYRLRKDGVKLNVSLYAVPLKDGQGNTVGIISLSLDISKRVTAEEALRYEKEFNRALLENMLDAVVACDANGKLVMFNRAARELHSVDTNNIPQESWVAFDDLFFEDGVTPMSVDSVPIARAFRGETLRNSGMVIRKKGQDPRHILANSSPVFDNDHKKLGAVAVLHDITERMKSEEALRFTQSVVDNMQDTAIWIAPDAHLVYVNKAATDLLGYTSDELLNMTVPDICPDFPIDSWVLHWEEVRKQHAMIFESSLLTRDSCTIPVEIRANIVTFEDKEYNCAIVRDITERKKSEESLLHSEQKFRGLIENGVDMISVISPQGVFQYASPEIIRKSGYDNDMIIGHIASEFIHPDDIQHARKTFALCAENPGVPISMTYRIIRKDGTSLILEGQTTNMLDVPGVNGMVGNYRDVTEHKKAEEALVFSEQRFRGLIENNVDIVTVIDISGTVTYVNPRHARFAGYDIDELIGHNMADFTHPDDMARAAEVLQKCIENPGVPVHTVIRLKSKDGSYWTNEGYITNLLDVPGIRGVVGNFRDITERQRAEKDLEESETRYKTLANAVSESVSITHDGVFVDVNDQYLALLGYTREEIIGTPGINHVAPESREMVSEYVISNRSGSCECLLINSRGERVEVEVYGKTLQKGDTEYHIAIVRDLTEQKRVERELRSANEEFRIINRLISETTALADTESVLDLAVDESLKIVGLEGGTICLVRPDDVLELVTHRATSQETIDDINAGNIRVGECLCGMCAKTGKPLILSSKEEVLDFATREVQRQENITFHAAFPLMVESGPVGVLCVFTRTDKKPTERSLKLLETMTKQIALAIDRVRLFAEVKRSAIELEERILDRTIQLEYANKELEAFSYTVSHDLRTPLRAINGFTEAILQDYEDILDASGIKYLNRIKAASLRMGDLIDDILRLSRINRMEMTCNRIDLSELVDSIAADLAESQPDRKVEFASESDVIVNADADLIKIALENLIGNAWKFTSKNESARIEFGVIRDTDKPIYFIQDNGVGFDQAYADKLFLVFQRLVTDEEFPGTGVGLATVKRIIQRHGGNIWVEGEIGKGAVFYFTLESGT